VQVLVELVQRRSLNARRESRVQSQRIDRFAGIVR
jgi:hypothetical protein